MGTKLMTEAESKRDAPNLSDVRAQVAALSEDDRQKLYDWLHMTMTLSVVTATLRGVRHDHLPRCS